MNFPRVSAKLSNIYNHINPELTIHTLVSVSKSRVQISVSNNGITLLLITAFVYKKLKDCQNILYFIV